MKKLFGRDKPKMAKVTPVSRDQATGIGSKNPEQETPIYASMRTAEGGEDRWEMIDDTPTTPNGRNLPPGASPPVPNITPGTQKQQSQHQLLPPTAKTPTPSVTSSSTAKPIAALGILRALDPHAQARAELAALRAESQQEHMSSRSEEFLAPPSSEASHHHHGQSRQGYDPSVNSHNRSASWYRDEQQAPPHVEKKKGFWDRGPGNKEKEREREMEAQREREYARNYDKEREREAQRDKEHREKEDRVREWERDTAVATGMAKPERPTPTDRERPSDRDRERDRERALARDKEIAREREREREKRDKRSEENEELTRMIGFLTATASEDWALVLEVCERASANETCAKEAVRALRREFKYGEPSGQLSAARLWAIMLRNSSEAFIIQSKSRKFLDAIEDLILSSRTQPVVRERLLYVVGAAAYASTGKDPREGFRGLWRRVKPVEKPEEGVPFDTDDSMFTPPAMIQQQPAPRGGHHDQRPYDAVHIEHHDPNTLPEPPRKRNASFSRNRIIPPEEDMRRLFQECKIGQGNANLLSEALAFAKPEDLRRKEIIQEFYKKCKSSQELIFAQIPWASAGAEQSRMVRDSNSFVVASPELGDAPLELTLEEELLAALLASNESLLEALRVYDDLERVGIERDAEKRSRQDVRMDRAQLLRSEEAENYGGGGGAGGAPSPPSSDSSPDQSPAATHHSHPHSLPRLPPNLDPASLAHQTHSQAALAHVVAQTTLAPPPPAPQGPRSPGFHPDPSRTPSPEPWSTSPPPLPRLLGHGHSRDSSAASIGQFANNGQYYASGGSGGGSAQVLRPPPPPPPLNGSSRYDETAPSMSAKAMGKQRVLEEPADPEVDDLFEKPEEHFADERLEEEEIPAPHWKPTQYVYDAAAERTEQRLKEGHEQQIKEDELGTRHFALVH